MLNLRES